MNKIIYIADPEILAIPIKECGEPLIDLNDQTRIQYGPMVIDIGLTIRPRLLFMDQPIK